MRPARSRPQLPEEPLHAFHGVLLLGPALFAWNWASASAPSASAFAIRDLATRPVRDHQTVTRRTARGQRAASLGSW